MAEYVSRLEELDRQIDEVRRGVLTTESAGSSVVLASFVRFTAAVASYGDWRDRVLNDGLPIVKAESDGTAEKYHRRWYQHYLRAVTDAFRTFSELRPSEPAAEALAATIASQESIAFDIIAGWAFARVQGEVRERPATATASWCACSTARRCSQLMTAQSWASASYRWRRWPATTSCSSTCDPRRRVCRRGGPCRVRRCATRRCPAGQRSCRVDPCGHDGRRTGVAQPVCALAGRQRPGWSGDARHGLCDADLDVYARVGSLTLPHHGRGT